MQAGERWQNVGMGEVEVVMPTQLRWELGLDSPAKEKHSAQQRKAVQAVSHQSCF
jgi:hypothetical protein